MGNMLFLPLFHTLIMLNREFNDIITSSIDITGQTKQIGGNKNEFINYGGSKSRACRSTKQPCK